MTERVGLLYFQVVLEHKNGTNRCGSNIGDRHKGTQKLTQWEQPVELTSRHAVYLVLQCRLHSHLRRIQNGNAFNGHLRLMRCNHICCGFITPSDHVAFEERWLSDAKQQEFKSYHMNSLNKTSQE